MERRMNLNFQHRHYAKCAKCHKIHSDHQHRTNLNLSNERTSGGLLDTLNNENDIGKDIDAETEVNTEKEFDEHCYSYQSRPFATNKYEVRRINRKPSMNNIRDASHRCQSINLNDEAEYHILRDADITSPLEKLKELQKQRASSDNYYSREIQKIIGKYFMTTYDPNKNRRSKNAEDNRSIKTAGSEELEQCGVITTIIRLDCGCVRRTRQPIYTPSIADARRTHYYHCADGDTDTIISKSPISSPTRSPEKPTLFEHPPGKTHIETTMPHILPTLDETDMQHSTLKFDNSKSLRDSFHRRSAS